MIKKRILNAQRIRRIDGGFSFIPHRFLTEGFFSALDPDQLLLYFFLVGKRGKRGKKGTLLTNCTINNM